MTNTFWDLDVKWTIYGNKIHQGQWNPTFKISIIFCSPMFHTFSIGAANGWFDFTFYMASFEFFYPLKRLIPKCCTHQDTLPKQIHGSWPHSESTRTVAKRKDLKGVTPLTNFLSRVVGWCKLLVTGQSMKQKSKKKICICQSRLIFLAQCFEPTMFQHTVLHRRARGT